ncbi:MAG: hypothetical protein RBR71_07955 [Gudongella sp.]|nr:hypothetical protein [Gudongella sp.]
MKRKVLLATLICILVLTGCNKGKIEQVDVVPNVEPNNTIPSPVTEVSEDTKFEEQKEELGDIYQPDFSSEEGIRDYLVGEWVYDLYYRGDVICTMNIDEDLNVDLSFENSYSDEPKGDYKGKITFDSVFENPENAPDVISLKLFDTEEPGGDFFFLHRTVYDGKRVMSWFLASNGNTVFDVADPMDGFRSVAEEIIFEKETGEESKEKPRENDEFYAVYWGTGADEKSIWLDDVWWTPPEEEGDFAQEYPRSMTQYETDIPESVLYNIVPDQSFEILGEEIMEGAVYFVQTNEEGDIIYLIDAERKMFMEDSYINPEAEGIIYNVIENDVEEIKPYLEAGMAILLTGETAIIEDEECYLVILGTHNEESFVRELYYAINIYTLQVYRLDILNDIWEAVTMG